MELSADMKIAHTVKLSVFVGENEDSQHVRDLFHRWLPLDWEKEKLSSEIQKATSFEQKVITIMTLTLAKEAHTSLFLKNLFSKLDAVQKRILLHQLESRLDEELNFFIRLDKNKLLKENKYAVTDSGDCFHIKISVAAFPKKMDVAKEVVRKLLDVEWKRY